MRIAFISNFLSLHQQPLCEALFHAHGVEFRFIALTPISQNRKQMDWEDINDECYVIKTYADEEKKQEALQFISSANVVILGYDKVDIFFQSAVKNKAAIIYRYSERLYKRGRWHVFSPRGIWNRWKTYFRYPTKKQYLLCTGAYVAKDYALLGSFLGKCFKWGYFPPSDQYDIEQRILQKKPGTIFWAGRLLSWKHPEIAIMVAKQLQDDQISFEMNIAGDGPMLQSMKSLIMKEGLEKKVHLLGSCTPEVVRQYMAESSIFLATSDYQEGWGAVVNEAMSEGCAVVGSEAMGSVPYLIQSGKNGYSFPFKKADIACKYVEELLLDSKSCHNIMKSAYLTIQNEWNGNCAAHRLVLISDSLLNRGDCNFTSGPCSKAELL